MGETVSLSNASAAYYFLSSGTSEPAEQVWMETEVIEEFNYRQT
jgi:hypothetical protein